MFRRFLFTAALSLALGPLAQARPQDGDGAAPSPPHYSVSKEQLQSMLAQRFPRHYPVQGLLDLDLQSPQLQLLPQSNRLSLALTVLAAGPALQNSHSGELALEFALRYEPSDRSLRATQLRLLSLQFPTLQPRVAALLNAYGPTLAQQSMREVVVHQLQPGDLAVADALGLQPDSITVTASGLEIGFVAKPR